MNHLFNLSILLKYFDLVFIDVYILIKSTQFTSISSPFLPMPSSPNFIFFLSPHLLKLNIHWVHWVLPVSIYMDAETSSRAWVAPRGLYLRRKLTLPQQPSVAYSFSTSSGTSWAPPPLMLGFLLAWSCSGLVHVCSYTAMSCHVTVDIYSPWLLQSLCYFFCDDS